MQPVCSVITGDETRQSRFAPPGVRVYRFPGRAKLGLFVCAVLLAVAWANTFRDMWLRWFPAWNAPGLTLSSRFTEGDSYYTHAPLVPLVSLLIAHLIHKRGGLTINVTRRATVLGWAVLLPSLLAHLASVYARVTFVSGYALVGVLCGLVLIRAGRELFRAFAFPLACLVFMVPLPLAWIADLNFALKIGAAESAAWVVNWLFHVPVLIDGSYVHLPSVEAGELNTLVVENVCGGLRSLIALLWFASVFAFLSRVVGWRRWLVFVMAVPFAIGCNVARFTGFMLVAHRFGSDAVAPDGWFHHGSGLLAFALAVTALFLIERMISRARAGVPRDRITPSELDTLDRASAAPAESAPEPMTPRRRSRSPAAGSVLSLTALGGTALLSALWSLPATARESINVARKALPLRVTIDGQVLTGRDFTLDAKTLTLLETNDYVYRRFAGSAGDMVLDVVIIFSADNRKGIHPPEVCLEGAGQHVIHKRLVHVELQGSTPAVRLAMRELVTQHESKLTYHLYTYKAGDVYSPNYLRQQAAILLNGLRSRDAAGALIRLSVPIDGEDVDRARRWGYAAARTLLPRLTEELR